MKTIEELHNVLDMILKNRKETITDYYEVDFYTLKPIVVMFKLISPSGKTYIGLNRYKLSEIGLWYYEAESSEGSTSGNIVVDKDKYGKYATCEINL